MFRLTLAEWQGIRSQSVTAPGSTNMRPQIVTASQSKRNTSVPPYALTEQSVTMLNEILNSATSNAIGRSIVNSPNQRRPLR